MAISFRKPKGVSKMQKQKLEFAKSKTEEEITKEKIREHLNPAILILQELLEVESDDN